MQALGEYEYGRLVEEPIPTSIKRFMEKYNKSPDKLKEWIRYKLECNPKYQNPQGGGVDTKEDEEAKLKKYINENVDLRKKIDNVDEANLTKVHIVRLIIDSCDAINFKFESIFYTNDVDVIEAGIIKMLTALVQGMNEIHKKYEVFGSSLIASNEVLDIWETQKDLWNGSHFIKFRVMDFIHSLKKTNYQSLNDESVAMLKDLCK